MQKNEESLYARYISAGRRFEIAGGLTLAAGAAGYALTGGNGAATALMLIGFLVLIFGVANLRPNNQIKAFAAQLTNTPDAEFAQGLLDAMRRNRKTLLSGRSMSNVEQAIETYAMTEGADSELVEALRAAVGEHIRKMLF